MNGVLSIFGVSTLELCTYCNVLFNIVHLGAQPVATVHSTVPAKAYGMVNNLSIRQFGSKKMLHLHPPGDSAICTMILCHRNETMLSELKVSKVCFSWGFSFIS